MEALWHPLLPVIAVAYVGGMSSYSSVTSCTLVGVEPRAIRIETTVAHAKKDSFTIVGLPDTAGRESRERVRAAMKQRMFGFPRDGVVVNLSPADLPKNGVTFDLPSALGVLAALVGVKYGKAAATGFVAILLLFLKKAWFVLLLPLVFLIKLFTGKKAP